MYPLLTCWKGNAVWTYSLKLSHGNLLLAVSHQLMPLLLTVVSWLSYLILAVDLWGSSGQHLIKCTIDLSLDSSPYFTSTMLLPIVSVVIDLCGLKNTLRPQSLLSTGKPLQDNNCKVLLQLVYIWYYNYRVTFLCLELS